MVIQAILILTGIIDIVVGVRLFRNGATNGTPTSDDRKVRRDGMLIGLVGVALIAVAIYNYLNPG